MKNPNVKNYVENPMGYFNDKALYGREMLKKAQFGWIGKLTGSKYIMGPRSHQPSLEKAGEKAGAKAKGLKSTVKKTVKKSK